MSAYCRIGDTLLSTRGVLLIRFGDRDVHGKQSEQGTMEVVYPNDSFVDVRCTREQFEGFARMVSEEGTRS